MSVSIRVPTQLRMHTDGKGTVAAEGSTIGEVLKDLVSRFPGIGASVITDDGSLHKFVNVYVNDDDVRYLDKLDTTVKDGDDITILPAVAGGAA